MSSSEGLRQDRETRRRRRSCGRLLPPAPATARAADRLPIRRPAADRFWRDVRRRRMLALADVGAAAVASLLVTGSATRAMWALALLPGWVLIAKLFGLYDRDQRSIRHLTFDEMSVIAAWVAAGTAMLGLLLSTDPARPGRASAPWSAAWLAVTVVAGVLRGTVRWLWRHTTPPELTAVLGEGELASAARRKLELFGDMHLRLVDDGGLPLDGMRNDDRAASLRELVLGLDRVIVAMEWIDPELIGQLAGICRDQQVKLSVVSPLRGRAGASPHLSAVAELPVLEYDTRDPSRSTMLIKRVFDFVVSAGALVVLAPLFPLVVARDQARQQGPGVLQAAAGRQGRRALPHVQAAHHGRRRRAGAPRRRGARRPARADVQAASRSAGHQDGAAAAPLQPRRAAAARQRPAWRHEHRRPAPGAGRARRALPSRAPLPAGREPGHDRADAGLRTGRSGLRRAACGRVRLRGESVSGSRPLASSSRPFQWSCGAPAPISGRCQACGGELVAWRSATATDPELAGRREYALAHCVACGTATDRAAPRGGPIGEPVRGRDLRARRATGSIAFSSRCAPWWSATSCASSATFPEAHACSRSERGMAASSRGCVPPASRRRGSSPPRRGSGGPVPEGLAWREPRWRRRTWSPPASTRRSPGTCSSIWTIRLRRWRGSASGCAPAAASWSPVPTWRACRPESAAIGGSIRTCPATGPTSPRPGSACCSSAPRFRLERISHLLVEQNPLGMWQTLLNRLTRPARRGVPGAEAGPRARARDRPRPGADRDRRAAAGARRGRARARSPGSQGVAAASLPSPKRWSRPMARGQVSLATVIVPTVAGGPRLTRLLSSLDDRPKGVEVLVVDNGSADPGIGGLGSRFEGVEVIRLERNVGYSRAVNLAAREATGDALVLLNDDCVCDPGYVEAIVAPLDPSAGVTMAAGVMLEARQPSRIDTAGMQLDRTLLVFDYLNGEPVACLDQGVPDPIGPSGAAAAFDRKAFLAVGRLRRDAVRVLGGRRPGAEDAGPRGPLLARCPRAWHPRPLGHPRVRLVAEELPDGIRPRLRAAQVGRAQEPGPAWRGSWRRMASSALGSWSSIAASPECGAGFAGTGPPRPARRSRARRLRRGALRTGCCGPSGGGRRDVLGCERRRHPEPRAPSLASSRSSTWQTSADRCGR